MKNGDKRKSNIIFWSIFVGILLFLYATPWGSSLRDWISSSFLSSPNIEENTVVDQDKTFLDADWKLISTSGEEIWLTETDKPIFLNIWATWCGPCRSEMPSIIDLEAEYGDKVLFLLISPSESLQ